MLVSIFQNPLLKEFISEYNKTYPSTPGKGPGQQEQQQQGGAGPSFFFSAQQQQQDQQGQQIQQDQAPSGISAPASDTAIWYFETGRYIGSQSFTYIKWAIETAQSVWNFFYPVVEPFLGPWLKLMLSFARWGLDLGAKLLMGVLEGVVKEGADVVKSAGEAQAQ